MILTLLFLAAGYALGSVNTAILVCQLTGLPDPRTTGSQNPGATNVLRSGGKKLAATVLIFDALKGYAPVLLASALGLDGMALGLVYLSTVLGHVFPLFFNFQGGKGVATTLGGLLALDPLVGVMTLLIWALAAKIYGISSVGAIAAAIAIPLLLLWHQSSVFLPSLLVSALLLYKHHGNITRLIAGTEPKIGEK